MSRGGRPAANPGPDPVIACDRAHPCPGNQICIAGLCQRPDAPNAGARGRARVEVCTRAGCDEPLEVRFGGSRVGEAAHQILTVRSIGERPLTVRHVDLLNPGRNFDVAPRGALALTLRPGEEAAFRVTHRPRDGIADDGLLQIMSDADARPRVLVQLRSGYKGVPSLFVGEDPASNTNETQRVDFGNVPAGRPKSRVLYLKNKDRIVDGSILTVNEVRIDPPSSTQFTVTLDAPLPAFINRFDSLCMRDESCRGDRGERCDPGRQVCRTAAGTLRDVVTATVTFVGHHPGRIDETLLILSNDGGNGPDVRSVNLRAFVTFRDLVVTPDPVLFSEAYVGFAERRAVTLHNIGTGPMTVDAVTLTETSSFALDLGELALPVVLDPQAAVEFHVAYAPSAVGRHTAAVTIASSDADQPATVVGIRGSAFIAPRLSIAPTEIDFGDAHVQVGPEPNAMRAVTVANDGGSELRVGSIAATAGTPASFTVDRTALAPIPPGGEETFHVRYGPIVATYPTVERGALELLSNDPRSQPRRLIPVAGRGVNPTALVLPSRDIDCNALDTNPNRPEIFYGQELVVDLALFNGGSGPMTVTSVSLAPDARNAFAVDSAPAVPFTIDQGENRVIAVRYAATGPERTGHSFGSRPTIFTFPRGSWMSPSGRRPDPVRGDPTRPGSQTPPERVRTRAKRGSST